jgi:hypothetical protein
VGATCLEIKSVEAFRNPGKNVAFMDTVNRILTQYLDQYCTTLVEEALTKNRIHLARNQSVWRFEGVEGKAREVATSQKGLDVYGYLVRATEPNLCQATRKLPLKWLI